MMEPKDIPRKMEEPIIILLLELALISIPNHKVKIYLGGGPGIKLLFGANRTKDIEILVAGLDRDNFLFC